MPRHRLRFAKTGKAVYLSHLDLMRTMQRAFLRTGVTIRHTEGFNPHAYISVALPLSVGVESRCELLDFERLDGPSLDRLPELLTAQLPEGIEVISAYEAETKVKDIAWLSIAGTLEYDAQPNTAELAQRLTAFFAQPELSVKKRTKKKEETELNIAPLLRQITFVPDGDHKIKLEAVVAAQNPPLGPGLLLDAISQKAPDLAPDFTVFSRLEAYDREMRVFL
ncbi:MAG: TIGR03936 family radical SAM-associated protein [Oscillospiraceae bacterium]|nr:TIGR03936 family radical SAM-associated protein [Oscillospiraceae bacterium]